MLKSLLTTCLLTFLVLFMKPGHAATYYVSPTGNDAANGSQSNPFKTIAKAATLVLAGDTVLVAGGTYLEKNIVPGNSGTVSSMIVFKPKPATGAVIIQHPATTLADDTPVFNLSNRSYIRIEGFQFKDFLYGKASIYISTGQGNVVMNNRFENLGNVEAAVSYDGNAAIFVSRSQKNIIRNNYFTNITGDGISINGTLSLYNLVSENTFITFRGKRRSWSTADYLFSRTIDVQDMPYGNNVIAFNYARDVISHIWLDRHGSGNIMLRNVAHNSSCVVFNESRCAFNVIQENIGYNLTGPAFQTARYPETGMTFDARWINNVAYNCHTGFYVHKSRRDEFRNNIAFNNTSLNLVFTDTARFYGPHIFRNNLWFTETKTNSIQLGNTAVSVPVFQSSVAETGGLSANPLFTNLTAGSENFTLQPSSPAAGAGDEGVDMGAYAVYGPTAVGWDPALQTGDAELSFGSPISAAKRGESIQLTILLNKAVSGTVTATIVPVAGDGRNGEDFQMNQQVTFQPGETSKTITVSALGGANYDELIAFRIENTVNAQAGPGNIHLVRLGRTAHAGPDQTIVQKGSSVPVTLDGSGSNGTISSYVWSEGDRQIATGVNPTVDLAVGTHIITLTVTTVEGKKYTDKVVISLVHSSDVWLEAECRNVGALWNIEQDNTASNGKFVTIEKGNNSSAAAPSDAIGQLSYTFDVRESGAYALWLRVKHPDANGDSYWLKMDNEAFVFWNDIVKTSSWTWTKRAATYNLSAGSHTLIIGFREDDANLDKILLTKEGTEPSDAGNDANNCTPPPPQKIAVKAEAESGAPGSDWKSLTASGITYITSATNQANSTAPGNAAKVNSYTVTFPRAGTYHLYVRMRVGSGAANDDSYYYGNGFGTKNPATGTDWITCNGISGQGYSVETDVVGGTGAAPTANNSWKWINFSQYIVAGSGSEPPISFTVPAGALTQTFQIGGREDGFDIDKLVFGSSTTSFTVKELNEFTGLINQAPVITAAQSFSISENAPAGTIAGVVTAGDPDGTTPGNWKITGGTGAALFTIDPLSGAIKVGNGVSLDYERATSYSLLVKVSDGMAPSVVESVTIQVKNENDLVPIVRVTAESRAYDGQPYAASAYAQGIGGVTDALAPRPGLVYRDAFGNELSGAPVAAGTYRVIASFAGNDNYQPAADSALITILPKAITVKAEDRVKECATVLDLGTTAFTVAGLVAGDAISSVSLSSTGASPGSRAGNYTIAVSDAQGTGLANYTITYEGGTLRVQDHTQPVPVVAELPLIQGELSVTVAAVPAATDGCAGTITATTTDPLTYNQQGTYTIIWTYDDGNGNTAVQTQTVVVKDKTAPVVTHLPEVPVQCYRTGGTYTLPALTATDNSGTAVIFYTISGATSRSSSGGDASGSFSVGTSTINWIIRDGHGNETTAQTTVTVNGPVTAAIADVYALSGHLDAPNTLYYGYGPSSLTLQATAGGGTAPYRYAWNGGGQTASLSVAAGGAYTITVSDANNCTATASLLVKTQDVSCGNDGGKVKVCHNGKDICIAQAAVSEHLAHGDRLGGCNDVASLSVQEDRSEAAAFLQVYPNPVGESLTIRSGRLQPGATVEVFSAGGVRVLFSRLTATVQRLPVSSLTPGLYYVRVRNGAEVITEKVVK